jgi:hypothetical protein
MDNGQSVTHEWLQRMSELQQWHIFDNEIYQLIRV